MFLFTKHDFTKHASHCLAAAEGVLRQVAHLKREIRYDVAAMILWNGGMRRALALALAAVLLLGHQPARANALGDGYYAYRHQRYAEALAILKPLALEGNPYAEFNLAVMYDDGLGVPRNFTLALFWYRKAGSQGLADGQYMAGRFYGSGRGVKQDPASALFWFELASAGGHPLAPALRDQHWNQLNRPVRERVAAEATGWQSEHPAQFTCKWQKCIYPKWTARPGWTILNRDDFLPPGSP